MHVVETMQAETGIKTGQYRISETKHECVGAYGNQAMLNWSTGTSSR